MYWHQLSESLQTAKMAPCTCGNQKDADDSNVHLWKPDYITLNA